MEYLISIIGSRPAERDESWTPGAGEKHEGSVRKPRRHFDEGGVLHHNINRGHRGLLRKGYRKNPIGGTE
jgi:hypothetical protein